MAINDTVWAASSSSISSGVAHCDKQPNNDSAGEPNGDAEPEGGGPRTVSLRSGLRPNRFCFEFQWFLMALSVLPGRYLAISVHLFPSLACIRSRISSSSGVHSALRRSGRSWLCHRSRHCFPVRPTSREATSRHLRGPFSRTCCAIAASSAGVQGSRRGSASCSSADLRDAHDEHLVSGTILSSPSEDCCRLVREASSSNTRSPSSVPTGSLWAAAAAFAWFSLLLDCWRLFVVLWAA